jgi:hypothetical protein
VYAPVHTVCPTLTAPPTAGPAAALCFSNDRWMQKVDRRPCANSMACDLCGCPLPYSPPASLAPNGLFPCNLAAASNPGGSVSQLCQAPHPPPTKSCVDQAPDGPQDTGAAAGARLPTRVGEAAGASGRWSAAGAAPGRPHTASQAALTLKPRLTHPPTGTQPHCCTSPRR